MSNAAYEEEVFELSQMIQEDNPNIAHEDALRLARRRLESKR